VDEGLLDEVRRLAGRDRELERESARLRALAGDAEAVRERAAAIDAFFAAYADEESRLRSATANAREELERRRAEAERAAADLAAARKDEQRVAAERAVARAADRVADADARAARNAEAEGELEREAAQLQAEISQLEAAAAAVSAELPEVPGAPTGLGELVEWASRVRAHVFVAAGQLDTQRDRVIREAAELGSMLLGEALYGATPAQVLTRVEAVS
jgi:chromosome segregation ATPase